MSDATLNSLALFDDPSKWIVVRDIPIFREHISVLPDGKPFPIDQEELVKFASELQRLEQVEGVLTRLTLGHTLSKNPQTGQEPKETDQPPIVGFGRNAHVGLYGKSQLPAVLHDHWVRREQWEEYQKYPYRSPEVYLKSRQITGVALLKRDPKLDMGMTIFQNPRAPALPLSQPVCYQRELDGLSFYALDDESTHYGLGQKVGGGLDTVAHGAGSGAVLGGLAGLPFGKIGLGAKIGAVGGAVHGGVKALTGGGQEYADVQDRDDYLSTSAALNVGMGAGMLGAGDKPKHVAGTIGGGMAGEAAGGAIGTALGGPLLGRIAGNVGGSLLGGKLTEDAEPQAPSGAIPVHSSLAQMTPEQFQAFLHKLVHLHQSGGGPAMNQRGEHTQYGMEALTGVAAEPGMLASAGNAIKAAAGQVGDAAKGAWNAMGPAGKLATVGAAGAGAGFAGGRISKNAEPEAPAGAAPAQGGDDMSAMQDQIAQLSPEEFEQLLAHLQQMYQQAHGAGASPEAAAAPAEPQGPPEQMQRNHQLSRYERENHELRGAVAQLQQGYAALEREKIVNTFHAELRDMDAQGYVVTDKDFERVVRMSREGFEEYKEVLKEHGARHHGSDELLPLAPEGTDQNLPSDRERAAQYARRRDEREQSASTERLDKVLNYMRQKECTIEEAEAAFDRNGRSVRAG